MAKLRVTYDHQANAAYVYFTSPAQAATSPDAQSAYTYACDPSSVDGTINLDFDAEGRVIGIEILDARTKLPRHLLEAADRLDL